MAASSVAGGLAAAAGWVAANLAMIAATGGITLAIAGIVVGALWLKDHWSEVWAKIKEWAADAWGWIKDHWQLILAIITGPIGLAILWIKNNWGKITGWFGTAIDGIKSVFGNVIDVITQPFRTAFNMVADLWNGTLGKMTFTVPSWVPGIGGNGFSMPTIPHLAAGGIVKAQPGGMLAQLGEGRYDEAVIPLDGKSHGGGSSHTTNVTLNIGAGVIYGSPLEVARQLKSVMQNGQLHGINFGVPA